MKLKINFKAVIKKVSAIALKFKGLFIVAAVIVLVGYAGLLISRLVSLEPDQAYLADQRAKLDQTKINFDKKTIDTINHLQQLNPPIDLTNIGKSDPFSP
ncbi:MAG TPA: hypothetical protein VLE72_03025 [Candidatus Saccharimonadales bacterium]|nr:hypothetical protein [Candidatus Saccharimonadales bacterium]